MYCERSKRDPVRIVKDAYAYLRRTDGDQDAIDILADNYHRLANEKEEPNAMKSTFDMAAQEAEREPRRREIPQPGTEWVAPGEGSTWRQLQTAFPSWPVVVGISYYRGARRCKGGEPHLDCRTNLKLTGSRIQPYDRQRWESGSVE